MITYKEFIQNIIDTRGQWTLCEGYTYFEKHHIVPKCIGGKGDYKNNNFKKYSHNENCIWLTPREHFISHKLLWEENKDNVKLAYAFIALSRKNLTKSGIRINYSITPEEYEELKIAQYLALSNRKGENNPMYGKHHTEKTKKLFSEYSKHRSKELRHEIAVKAAITRIKTGCSKDAKNPAARSVLCIELNKKFSTVKEAKNWLRDNFGCVGNIARACKYGVIANGYHWKYADSKNIVYKQRKK